MNGWHLVGLWLALIALAMQSGFWLRQACARPQAVLRVSAGLVTVMFAWMVGAVWTSLQ